MAVISTLPQQVWQATHQRGGPVQEKGCHERAATHRTHTRREPLPTREFSQVHEVGGAICCGARQSHSPATTRSQPEVQKEKNRASWCKTVDQNGHGGLPSECAGRPNGSGYGRSSAEFVAALGPTVLQDGAAGTCAHAVTKAVLAKFASVIWLKGALHGASYWDKLQNEARIM